jgi:hypothetical protein
MSTDTCANPACRCTRPYSPQNLAMSSRRVEPDATYCSDRCETVAGRRTDAVSCECGHPECAPQNTPDIPPMM